MSEKLCFYTTGEGFTGLLTSFFEEGQFKKVYQILEDGGLPHDQIVLFFKGQGRFEGDSRDEGGLKYFTDATPEKVIEHRVYRALRNMVSSIKTKTTVPADDEDDEDYESYHSSSLVEFFRYEDTDKNEDLRYLYKVFDKMDVLKWIWPHVVSEAGFGLNPKPTTGSYHGNGSILSNGDFVTCDFMEHDQLYPFLYAFREITKVTARDWTGCDTSIHVSGGGISGNVCSDTKRFKGDGGMTIEQMLTCAKYKDSIGNFYGSYTSLMEQFRLFINELEDHGGKYNNLLFLKLFYPKIKLPQFSKESFPSKHPLFIRTSPTYSLPGLLESKLAGDNVQQTIDDMTTIFEQFKDVREDNKFHYFFQELIPGTNGVFHINKSGFSYAIGDAQGDVVKGKTSGAMLKSRVEDKLRKIAEDLYEDLRIPLQVEFVVAKDDRIFIVQLRKIENDAERTAYVPAPRNVIVTGKSFSRGTIDSLDVSDILIVDKDADSKQLLGKKALVVKSDVAFSHILALASSLKIPAMYATGDFDLKQKKVKFVVYNDESYICKLKN